METRNYIQGSAGLQKTGGYTRQLQLLRLEHKKMGDRIEIPI
jgi:hypothetical protein